MRRETRALTHDGGIADEHSERREEGTEEGTQAG